MALSYIRNRDPHRGNAENVIAICFPIVIMQHIRESPTASHTMRKSAWNDQNMAWPAKPPFGMRL